MDYVEISAQKRRLNKVVHMAGPRYDTRVNIVLPISFTFDVLGRTEVFNKKLLSLGTHIWEECRFIGRKPANDVAQDEYHKLTKTLKLLIQHLKKIRHSPLEKQVKWKLLSERCTNTVELINEILPRLSDLEENNKSAKISLSPENDLRAEIGELYRLRTKLRELESFVDGLAIAALSKNSVLINGQAGSGKTHLLCDIASIRIRANLPTYIFLGEEFTGADPLIRIAQLIHSGSNTDVVFKASGQLSRT